MLKIILFIFSSVEEPLSPEGEDMPKEEELEKLENSPLISGDPLNTIGSNLTHTSVHRAFPQNEPSTSSSTLDDTESSTRSSYCEAKFQMHKKNEGIFKN